MSPTEFLALSHDEVRAFMERTQDVMSPEYAVYKTLFKTADAEGGFDAVYALSLHIVNAHGGVKSAAEYIRYREAQKIGAPSVAPKAAN